MRNGDALRKSTYILICVGMIATAILTIYGTSDDLSISEMILIGIPMLLYVLSPYLLLFILTRKTTKERTSAGLKLALLISSCIVAIANLMLYYEPVFNSTSSTSGLIFAVLPFYGLILVIMMYTIGSWLINQLINLTKDVR